MNFSFSAKNKLAGLSTAVSLLLRALTHTRAPSQTDQLGTPGSVRKCSVPWLGNWCWDRSKEGGTRSPSKVWGGLALWHQCHNVLGRKLNCLWTRFGTERLRREGSFIFASESRGIQSPKELVYPFWNEVLRFPYQKKKKEWVCT